MIDVGKIKDSETNNFIQRYISFLSDLLLIETPEIIKNKDLKNPMFIVDDDRAYIAFPEEGCPNIESAIEILAHEMRHVCQWMEATKKKPVEFFNNDEIRQIRSSIGTDSYANFTEDRKSYYEQFIEKDAYTFSWYICEFFGITLASLDPAINEDEYKKRYLEIKGDISKDEIVDSLRSVGL